MITGGELRCLVDVIYHKSFIVHCRFIILSYYVIITLLYRVGLFLIPTSYCHHSLSEKKSDVGDRAETFASNGPGF